MGGQGLGLGLVRCNPPAGVRGRGQTCFPMVVEVAGGGGRLGLEVSIAALGVAWNGTFLLLPSPQLGESLGPALGLW